MNAWPRTVWEGAFIFEPRDFWIGVYVDKPRRSDGDLYWSADQRTLYEKGTLTSIYCMLLPTLGLRFRIRWRDLALPTDALE